MDKSRSFTVYLVNIYSRLNSIGFESGEFNEQAVDDIFLILKKYGKNIRILFHPIVKEADIALE